MKKQTQQLFNLEKWNSQTDQVTGKKTNTKTGTLVWQVPYGMALGIKKKAECQRQLPGTYFIIVPNEQKSKIVDQPDQKLVAG